ncbi:4Fe-4S dicluster domain-containing protein [Oceanicella actignis]|uniref:4Fe-4S dicluster domain-containing protein n=1 Tax=Oceanicella actignis TaxID=1189325 RepID=UPI0011E6C41B|nr:4Fe-4S dicluster domain-containing protein [Oceanicella actignis]TYO90473.1 4Fe-4S dicluster protein [Oceanicella actignis]
MPQFDALLVCDCAGSMRLNPDALADAAGVPRERTRACSRLCTAELDAAREALGSGATLIACGQMAGLFHDLAAELGAEERLTCVDIRDRAGWTDAGDPTPKQAALLAEAALDAPPMPAMDVRSDGVCLVLAGARPEPALEAARLLAPSLSVTVIAEAAPDLAAPPEGFELALGRLRAARGALGGFEVTIDGFAPLDPAGRGAPRFGQPRDGARSGCDVIVDLRGGAPAFPAPDKRDGYVRVDPAEPGAAARAALEAGQLRGEFEKTLHIRFDPMLCAHSRARKPGCSRCLEVCPTGAIQPAGDAVSIDPMVCAGCGACAAVCPSGAASYDAPPVAHLFARLRTLASAWRAAAGPGGGAPRVLFHDAWGAEMIALSARFGRGLPADVIPVEVPEVEGVGHAELMAALGSGFAQALILAGPRTERAALAPQLALTRALLRGARSDEERAGLIEPADPDALEAALRAPAPPPHGAAPIMALGGRREVARLAVAALAGDPPPEPFALPAGAPYGAVEVNADACTLCLACVSLCPVGALGDNPDRPQLRFQEAACLQCGICAATCPESAITLVPRFDPRPQALSARVLHEEEPFECVECGKPFGVRSTIERIAAKLEGKHWLYANPEAGRMIRMCDDCRVRAQFHARDNPFALGAPRRPRTTDDYLSADDED